MSVATATDLDVAWLAGILEGEGCFHHRKDDGRVIVRLFMTDEDVVARVARIIGTTYTEQRRVSPQKTGWQIWAGGVKARETMRAIEPHMGERRAAMIRLCLGTPEPRPPGPWTTTTEDDLEGGPSVCPQGHAYTVENTYMRRGVKLCRACDRERHRASRNSEVALADAVV